MHTRPRGLGRCSTGVQAVGEFQQRGTNLSSWCYSCAQIKEEEAEAAAVLATLGSDEEAEVDVDGDAEEVTTVSEDKDSDEMTVSTSTTQFTSYNYVAAANRGGGGGVAATPQPDEEEEESEEAPAKPRGGTKRKLGLLESFESDLAVLEHTWMKPSQPLGKRAATMAARRKAEEEEAAQESEFAFLAKRGGAHHRLRRGKSAAGQGLDEKVTNPYGFKSAAAAEPEEEDLSESLETW